MSIQSARRHQINVRLSEWERGTLAELSRATGETMTAIILYSLKAKMKQWGLPYEETLANTYALERLAVGAALCGDTGGPRPVEE